MRSSPEAAGSRRVEDKATQICNRIVECTKSGISYGAEHRHVDFILANLEYRNTTKRSSPPGNKELEKIDDTRLAASDPTPFGATIGRCLALSLDRPAKAYADVFHVPPEGHGRSSTE